MFALYCGVIIRIIFYFGNSHNAGLILENKVSLPPKVFCNFSGPVIMPKYSQHTVIFV